MGEGINENKPGLEPATIPNAQSGMQPSPARVPDLPVGAEDEDPSTAASSEVHPNLEHEWQAPPPRLIRDTSLWVVLWVVGAIILVVLFIVALSALPSKKGVGPLQHGAIGVTTPPVLLSPSAYRTEHLSGDRPALREQARTFSGVPVTDGFGEAA